MDMWLWEECVEVVVWIDNVHQETLNVIECNTLYQNVIFWFSYLVRVVCVCVRERVGGEAPNDKVKNKFKRAPSVTFIFIILFRPFRTPMATRSLSFPFRSLSPFPFPFGTNINVNVIEKACNIPHNLMNACFCVHHVTFYLVIYWKLGTMKGHQVNPWVQLLQFADG